MLTANGAFAESLLLAPMSLEALSDAYVEEIETLFPEVTAPDFIIPTARPVVTEPRRMKTFFRRHAKNNAPMYSTRDMAVPAA